MVVADAPAVVTCPTCGARVGVAIPAPASALDALAGVASSAAAAPKRRRPVKKPSRVGPVVAVIVGSLVVIGVAVAVIRSSRNSASVATTAGEEPPVAARPSSASQPAPTLFFPETNPPPQSEPARDELPAGTPPLPDPPPTRVDPPPRSEALADGRPSPQDPPAPRAVYPAPRQGVLPPGAAVEPTPPRPPARPTPEVVTVPAGAPNTLDARIEQSMGRAVDLILRQFQGNELPPVPGKSEVYRDGMHALCVYALLTAGQSLPDPRLSIRGKLMPQLIDAMKAHKFVSDGREQRDPVTYAHSLRAAALSVYGRPEDRKDLKADVEWLMAAGPNGEYTYDAPTAPQLRGAGGAWDNSNSQYGLLGVWAGAELGVEVRDRYWQAVEKHWKTSQQRDGQWNYGRPPAGASLAMTCGGLASLMVTYDYLDVPRIGGAVGRDPFPGPIGAGLKWLESGNNSVRGRTSETFYTGYDLFSLERVGLASGLKFLGTHDWYRELAETSLAHQQPDGSFEHFDSRFDVLVDTSYTLLFLARGRHPVFMDKLRFERFWANRPRDLANLTKFASRELERPMNWQIVSADRPWYDWFDSPVLFIASHQPPQISDAQYANLRSFAEAGGLIFTQADAGADAFNKWVPQLVSRVCPGAELQTLPPTHLLYSTNYRITAPPKLQAAGNGARLMVVHSPTDLSIAWQRRDDKMQSDRFRLGVNVFVYASGKKDFRNRVASPYVPDPVGEPTRKLHVARLKYAGNWDPEPYAWKRFSRLLQNETGEALDLEAIDADALKPQFAPLAHLTGTAAYGFTDAQCAAIAAYVRAGGVLLVDSTGGQPAFARSAEDRLLPRAFPGTKLGPLPADHPLMKDVTLKLRPYAADSLGRPPSLRFARIGKGYVIFTPLDLAGGLLANQTWGIVGYTPQTCEQLARNLVPWCETAGAAD